MTLVELTAKAIKHHYTDQQVKEALKSITIYEPEYSDDLLDETVYFIGDNNSWFEVIKNRIKKIN